MTEIEYASLIYQAIRPWTSGYTVKTVYVCVGAFRRVDPFKLENAWVYTTFRTRMRGSQLKVQWTDATIECERGHFRVVDINDLEDLDCRFCDSPTIVLSGNELVVSFIDLDGRHICGPIRIED
ncbi:hydrogenase maturation nickel metallochaperone HypA [Corynebacterium sp. ES2794-CONJ1]|uniref:hydrogenase maturation nickel metallochaperone HypA n=1 Tax=unclassified Corynebacterium TaxID=2624378 RepID=UPI002168A1B5|nr:MULTISPECIES: hydrogenase maturation nickel metallochaperone HypA [unclassified Corynebacterium]MCS4489503.1 hydrogenase maturation nickel metallochaperone HypA [Corynebacterium sp. ES2775-CONJ]MCU9518801.1 hydrogenase maturation nickel metallochaperone HypA [Corynebacterium sp. ES2794-CONJ1]